MDWNYCGKRPARLGPAQFAPRPGKGDPVAITADDFSYDQTNDQLTLKGGIDLEQGSRRIRSDALTYDLKTEQVIATGNVYLDQPRIRLIGSKAQLNIQTNEGHIEKTAYRFSGPLNAHGTAELAELLDDGKSQYSDIVYSTCKPGQRDWDLKAKNLEIDEKEGTGVARHARLRLAGVPVLYTPYISFPIDDKRKSGLLIPSVGSSNDSGFELITPYYLNIAPNVDATLAPRYMEKRGLMLGSEFRFLTPRHSGEFYAEGIAQDKLYEDDSARGAVRLLYRGNYGKGWSSNIKFNEVSDDQYLEDYGNRLEFTSIRNIERMGAINYAGKGWSSRLQVKDFQTVDSSIAPRNRPYALLPQLSLNIDPYRFSPGFELGLDAEYDYFDHTDKVHGQRIAAQPYIAWPIRKSYGYLIPRFNFYGASYSLEDVDDEDPSDPSYAIPSFNLDGQLIFERPTQWLGQDALQTLEPRAFYLYTAFEDQEDIPVFDSSELSFSYNSLFRPNRFTGRDRIGDTNQVTLGLTSRTLDSASGLELFRASLGQIFYLEDRNVQILGPPEDQSSSSIAGEVSARFLEDLSGRASFQWDPNKEEERTQKRVLELHYEPSKERLLNLAYRFDLGNTAATRYEDLDLSMRWPVTSHVEIVGRWYYSLLNSQMTEAFAGIEFGRCCWQVRVLGRHLKNKPDTNGETSVMVQLELAGLGNFGHRIDKLLERGIYGYHAE